MSKSVLILGVFFSFVLNHSWADEGMWPYNVLPLEQLKTKYGFTPSQEWLDHAMRSSVRFNSGGSGSFISSDGLVLTNHHVAADTLQKVSTPEHNYYHDGFYARTLSQEIPAPDLELNQLVSIEDVTSRINSVVTPGMTPAEAFQAQQKEMGAVEKESTQATGLRSDVVTLYNGGAYHLYRYKKYTDVRIVFAPEFAIAFFGGDPDNFEYPRYDLDMSIMRVYENGKPAKTDHFLKWSEKGAVENELIFVSGHPGKTSRLGTVAAFEFLRDYFVPFRLSNLQHREKALLEYGSQDSEKARQAKEELFSVQNSRKVYVGRLDGLRNGTIIDDKRTAEAELRKKVESTPELAQYAGAWDMIAKAQEEYRQLMKDYHLYEAGWALNSEYFSIARNLVRMAYEDQKDNSERLPEYKESARESLEQTLFSDAPIYPELEKAKMAESLTFMREVSDGFEDIAGMILGGRTEEELAQELVNGTILGDPAKRKEIAAGKVAAIETSTDPFILLALEVDGYARTIRKSYEDRVKGVEQQAYPQIAQAIFAIRGKDAYPDATFTLRLSFGTVKGYSQNGKYIPAWTTMGGAFEHETAHGAQDPYQLPVSWHDKKGQFDLNTPYDFVATADIIGGNSGSPVINQDGELVGLIFDGNIQSLVADYGYEDIQSRAVSVHSAAMLEALRKIYDAGDLADRIGK